jgi:hypothetical protein
MTDRIKGLTVLLEPDKRDDDAQCIIDAIRMIKGVVSVKSHIADMDHHLAVETARRELTNKLWDALK